VKSIYLFKVNKIAAHFNVSKRIIKILNYLKIKTCKEDNYYKLYLKKAYQPLTCRNNINVLLGIRNFPMYEYEFTTRI
jgi:hypothetical protein